jgi:cell division protein FtsL
MAGNYIYGSAAPKIEFEEKVEKKIKTATRQTVVKARKVKWLCVLSIFTVFLFTFVIMYRYAVLTEMRYKNSSANKAYNELLGSNKKLSIEIEKSTDLNKIKEAAERLGLSQADKNQKVFVVVPKPDFVYVPDKGVSKK